MGATVSVVVVAAESPRTVGGGRLMFRGDLKAVDDRPLGGRVVVFASGMGFGELTAGRPATFRARVGAPMRRDLTVAVLSAAGEPTVGGAGLVQRIAARVRAAFADAARTALPADQAAMLPALVLGDTSALTAPTVDEFRVAGLTHLTAVSGANVTIVCGAVLLAAGVVGPRAAVGMAGLALLAFVVVVQPSASVLRAAVMGAITLLAVVTHRRRQAIPALSATVVILMIGAPQLAVDVGFALSVSATAALVVIAPVWSRRLVDRGWPKPLADAASVAVAAQLVTAPLVAGMVGDRQPGVGRCQPRGGGGHRAHHGDRHRRGGGVGVLACGGAVRWSASPGPSCGGCCGWPDGRRPCPARSCRCRPAPQACAAWRPRGSAPSCCGGGGGAASVWRPRWSACWRGPSRAAASAREVALSARRDTISA